jgi:O-antigen/teichoic acid export membrane protein
VITDETMASSDDGAGRPRKRRDELVSNTGAMLTGRVLVAAMGWTGTILLTKSLTKPEFGQFTLVFTILGMLSIVTEMGVGRVAINGMMNGDIDRGRFAGSYVVMRCFMGVVGYLLALAVVLVLGYPPVIFRTTAIAGLVVLFATPNHALHLAFQTTMRMPRVAAAEVLGQSAQLALTIALVVHGGTVSWFAVPAVLCEVVILSTLFPMARRLVPYHFVVDTKLWWSMLREAVPITIGTAMSTIYYRIDTVMLSKIGRARDESIALYGIAYKFVDLAHFMVVALSVPILTLLVRAWPDDPERFRSAIRKGLTLLSVSAAVVLAETTVFARDAIRLLYPAYTASANATRILVVAECIGWFGSLALSILVATARHRRYPVITASGLVLNVVLNVFVIPRHSFTGAAVDTVVTEVFVASLLWMLALRLPVVRQVRAGRLLRLLPIAGGGAAVGYGLRRIGPWPVAATATAIVVVGLVHLLGVIGPRGLRHLVTGDDA